MCRSERIERRIVWRREKTREEPDVNGDNAHEQWGQESATATPSMKEGDLCVVGDEFRRKRSAGPGE